MTRPSHLAYVIRSAPEGSNQKTRWVEIGAVWPHKSGSGFDLILTDQLAVSGRIVCTVRRDNGQSGDER